MTSFTGKTVLITGGSSGIGLATAKKLAGEGAHLWLLADHQDPLIEAKGVVSAERSYQDQQVEILIADVRDPRQVDQAVQQFLQQAGTPDILINSAGITYPGDVDKLDLDIFKQLIDTNYLGTVNMTKAVLPGMIERGSGVIVNLASMGGVIGIPGYTAYAGSKFAVRGFSDALRAEVKSKGIHVSVVFPPDTDTPQLRNEIPLRSEVANFLSSLDSVMQPEEVAEAILQGIARKKFMIIPGLGNQFFYWLFSMTGTLAYPLLDQFIAWGTRNNHNHNHKPKPNS